MATGTGPFEAQDILNKVWFPPGTSPTADPDKVAVYLAGGSALVGSGSFQSLGQPFVVMQPAFRQFQLDAVTTGTGSSTGTATTGLGGFRHLFVYLRMSSMTGTISTLNIFVDSRLDGTNWVNLAQLSQVTSATGATAQGGIVLTRANFAGTYTHTDFAALDTDIGVGTARDIGWGDDLRIRRAVSGGTTAPIFSYTIWVNASS